MHIHCIQTGGTIDKHYPAGATHHGYNFEIGEPAIARILASSKCSFSHTTTELLKKDSLDITDEDRAGIVAAVTASPHRHILITHGTDTMHMTGKALSAITDKTIVLTGAMLPECFKDSEAHFNAGMAVAALQTLPAGVYVALYGQVLSLAAFIETHTT
jgi:L-asparaginase